MNTMLEKTATTQVPIHELIAKRWSPRAFDADKPVSREQISALLEAARWAPSCYGAEPWRFVVFDKFNNAAAWEKGFNCLAEANQVWVKNAPVLILAVTRNLFEHNGKPNRWAQYDCGAASENLCLQAVSMGLIAHQMGGFDANKAYEVLGIAEQDFTCMSMIAVGYQASPEVLEGDYKEHELAARKRKPLEEIFFEGKIYRHKDSE
jgi:nitroreductase